MLIDEYEAGYSKSKLDVALSLAKPELVHEAVILILTRASIHVIKNDSMDADEAVPAFVTLLECRDEVENECDGPVVSCA